MPLRETALTAEWTSLLSLITVTLISYRRFRSATSVEAADSLLWQYVT